jgi:hypothetical protein
MSRSAPSLCARSGEQRADRRGARSGGSGGARQLSERSPTRHAAPRRRALPALLPLLLAAALLADAVCGAGAARLPLSAYAAPLAAPAPLAAVVPLSVLLRQRPPPPPPKAPSRLANSLDRGAPDIKPGTAAAAGAAPVVTPKLINAGTTTSHIASFAFFGAIVAVILLALVAAFGRKGPRPPPAWHFGRGRATDITLHELKTGGGDKMTHGERMRLLKEAQLADHQYHTMPPVPPPAPLLRAVPTATTGSAYNK